MSSNLNQADLTIICAKATNPHNIREDTNTINEFCLAVNDSPQGPQNAVRILVPKIQSLNENEALLSLNLLEACVRYCGWRFHVEIGKFRFLNELIKLLSPKYLGSTTSDRVKKRVTELMYAWSMGIPNEPKIEEAYQMLKQQGLITKNPVLDQSDFLIEPEQVPPRPKHPIFDDQSKNERLTKLLRSKNKDDLEAANVLIRSMVREDEEKMERLNRRFTDLNAVKSSVRLITEMLDNYTTATGECEKELINELAQSCERMRPKLFQMAAETEENDELIGEILYASDEISRVIDRYRNEFNNPNFDPPPPRPPRVAGATDTAVRHSMLLDFESKPTASNVSGTAVGGQSSVANDIISQQLSELGISNSNTNPFAQSSGGGTFQVLQSQTSMESTLLGSGGVNLLDSGFGSSNTPPTNIQLSSNQKFNPFVATQPTSPPGRIPPPIPTENKLAELDELGRLWLQGPKPNTLKSNPSTISTKTEIDENAPPVPPRMVKQESESNSLIDFSFDEDSSKQQPVASAKPLPPPPTAPSQSLSKILYDQATLDEFNSLQLSIDDVIPNNDADPKKILSRNGITILLNYTKNVVLEDVTVFVITTENSSNANVSELVLSIAAPKSVKIRLLPSSTSVLPAKKPFTPPSIAHQILFLLNSTHELAKVKLRISCITNEVPLLDVVDVDLDSSSCLEFESAAFS